MPGRTIHLTKNPNDFKWSIPIGKGRAFEDLIHKYLKRFVATRDGRIRVVRTRATGDSGRDFEVYFSGEVELFGLKINQPTNGAAAVVFVECKSTEHDRLDDAFIIDASQHQDFEACSYILVTNAVLTPYSQHRARLEWERRKSIFRLVDRRRLLDELSARQLGAEASALGLPLPAASTLPPIDRSRVVVSCQTEQRVLPERQVAHLYMAMSNYGSESVLSEIGVATDLRWSAGRDRHVRVIEPGIVETLELTADRQEFEGPSDLDLTLSVNGRSQRLTVTRPNYSLTFEPQFIGESHRRIAGDIRKHVESTTGFALFSIQGEAGVGKTRTVKEALAPLTDGQIECFTYHFSRHQTGPSFEDFYEAFGINGKQSSSPTRVSHIIEIAASVGVPVLINFEDLHHADESVIRSLKQLVLEPPACAASLVLIITGRDDHTFPNEEYYSFLQLVSDQHSETVHGYTIQPLTDQDAETLIRSVVVDMPDPGVRRVQALGQNNPFVIVEILQYLLDARLAQLLSHRTIGVLNPEVFAGRSGLPATVEELYDRRLASLKEAPHGKLAREFLIVASFFSFIIDDEIRRAFFDGEEAGDECWSLLCERRFVKEDGSAAREATFAHENLLHYMRRMVRRPENAEASASLILSRPGLAKRLDAFDLGEAFYLYQDFQKAFERFTEIWERIQATTNFSSEEIDKRYFSYLPALFRAAFAVGTPAEARAKVALAYSYMGVHNYPLVVAEDACAASGEMLKEIYPNDGDGLRPKLAVRQLRAHALQNMGRTGQALREMLEIEAAMSEGGRDWHELEYDLFDRLQEYYRKLNHVELAQFYGRRARNSAARVHDEKLIASHLITQSLVCLYSGKREAGKRAAEARRMSERVGIQRFIMYTRLTELVVETLYSHQNPEVLRGIRDEARAMLRDAAVTSFSDSIMRLELLLGTLALNCYEEPEERHAIARYYIECGQANSLRFGNGLFDWAFDNLAAVVDLQDVARSDEEVRRRFRSCLERLRRRGLTFLGAQSGIYPNSFAISNVVRFYGQFQDSVGVELMRSAFSAYDNSFLEDESASLELVRRAVHGHPIFWPQKSRFQMMRYPVHGGYFTPVF